MILREATIRYKGYDPEDLKINSAKRVCISCDKCGRVKWSRYQNYSNLCKSCSEFGKKHKPRTDKQKENYRNSKLGDKNPQYGLRGELSPNYGKKASNETLIKLSCKTRRNIPIKDFVGFIGRHNKNRSYVLPEEKCIKMNDKFNDSHFHHITKSIGIFIPSELHNHIDHNMKTGLNMGEINMLSLQFIEGDYNF